MSRTLRWLLASVLTSACALALAAPAAAEDPPHLEWTSLLPTLTAGYDPSSSNECVAGRVQCVDKVIREMYKRFDPQADSCHHDAVFGLAYLRTTEEYRRAIEDPAFFRETPWVNHYDAVFATYYFDAADDYAAGRLGEVPEAWRIAFDSARDKRVSGSGNLYLGMNAHINRDLPYVLATIGLIRPDGSSRKDDHDKVNTFLNRVADELIPELAARFDPTMDDGEIPGTTLDNMALFQAIPTWRETAWRNAERLLAARTDAERAQVAQSIEDYATYSAKTFVAQTSYRPPLTSTQARDAWCAVHHG